eukprot:95095-Pyramimonas_sp.AAC.1
MATRHAPSIEGQRRIMATQSPQWYTVSFFPDDGGDCDARARLSSHKPAAGVVGTGLGFKKSATSASKSPRSALHANPRAKKQRRASR